MLRHIEAFLERFPGGVVLNLACGLSSYPYICKRKGVFIEVDTPRLVEFKEAVSHKLLLSTRLASIKVQRIGTDLLSASCRSDLSAIIAKQWLHRKPMLVVLEGLSYYLSSEAFRELMTWIGDLQRPWDRVAYSYWSYSNRRNGGFDRYHKFCTESKMQMHGEFTFLSRPIPPFESCYNCLDVRSAAKEYRDGGGDRSLRNRIGLPEYFCAFERSR